MHTVDQDEDTKAIDAVYAFYVLMEAFPAIQINNGVVLLPHLPDTYLSVYYITLEKK